MKDDDPDINGPPERPRAFVIDPPAVGECSACFARRRQRFAITIGWYEAELCRHCAVALFAGLDLVVPKDPPHGSEK